MSVASRPGVANAGRIVVENATDVPLPFSCTLREAIISHNDQKEVSFCGKPTGDDDVIVIKPAINATNTIDVGSPLPPIKGKLQIRAETGVPGCFNLRQAAYLTVVKSATLELRGISVVVNGAEFKSVIDNDGGTLIISPPGPKSGPCLFSNQSGRDRKTSLGGVLNNRNNGTTTIEDASFNDSSASDKGGAIYIDSGTVNFQRGDYSSNNSGGDGGAIYVNNGATLNIQSSNFSINNNTASGSGGAIYSNGGTVSIQRNGSQSLGNVSISSNSAGNGGAIYANGGKLSVDGVQFLGNSTSGSGGAIWLTGLISPNSAPITRSYFRANSLTSASGLGASIYATGLSTVNVSGDTFLRNTGGIYLDNLVSLGVINSTFLGASDALDGIYVNSGHADVTFSTILLSSLSGPGGTNVSSSLLRGDTCSNVVDDSNNLQYETTSCPGTLSNNPTLGLDPGFLKNNGGFTPTITLVPGSPGIDAIPRGDCVDLSNNPLKIDQRDAVRPDPTNTNFCDTGAVQSESTADKGLLPPGTPLN